MADDRLSLFCFVDGLPSSRAFAIEVSATRTISHLKDLIKTKQAPAFDDITVDQLTLWRVSIPDDNQNSAITIAALNDKTELKNPRTRVSKLFPESPDDNSYIIVHRPPPVTPIAPISVPQVHIKQELEIILSGVQHHYANYSLDPKELEMSQKEQLGPFSKRSLPYHRTAKDISLVMLGLELDKQAKASDGRTTLRSIVEDEIGAFSGNRVVAMVAPSGSGKTATVIDLATKHFVVYCVCSSPRATCSHDFIDSNFIALAKAVEKLYLAVVDEKRGDQLDIRCQGDKLISPSALSDNRGNGDAIFDGNNQVQLKYRRGFLTTLSATLSNMQATLVIFGTALSLQNADQMYPGLDKPSNFTRITDFPQFDANNVNKMISDLVDLSNCEIPPAKRRKLSGRARFSLGIINRLIANPTQISKQATLDNAIDLTIEQVKRGLRGGVQSILEYDKTGEAFRLLCRMVLANHLHGGKVSFSSSKQSDFVNKALCRLRQDSDGVHLIMDEPIVLEAVEEELKKSGQDSAFSEYLDQLYQIVTNFGIASTSKGDALRSLVRLMDLPFLQGITLPNWCDDLKLQIDGINTANGFGYTD
ncbi:hypothetical protein BGZ47_008367, partial [Haplosporangium gracile]